MLSALPSLLAPLLVLLVFLFLFFRLGFFAGRDIGGRAMFVSGGVLVFSGLLWQALTVSPQYYDWFVAEAYPWIEIARFAVLSLGVLLVVSGLALYADYWQTRREDLDIRQGKLSVLENLQHDARQPYHLLELLNLSLKEILGHLSGATGAVFLVNMKQRRFVLTTSSGLSREETAALEYYPMERNVVSQAVEIGDPMLTSGFTIPQRGGGELVSYQSCLILPMTSGLEKIGVILLLSERKQAFSRTDIRYLAPVANWLGEKVRSARLVRELSQNRSEVQARRGELSAVIARYNAAGTAVSSGDAVAAFCQALVGFLQAESVHLCGLRQGGLTFYGGSEPLSALTENYRTALVDAIGRTRPLIINQEAADSGGGTVLVSSLVLPLDSQGGGDALMLVRSGKPFSISEHELKQLDSFAGLARLVLRHNEYQRLRLTRRKGFDAILKLLKADPELTDFRERPQGIVDYIATILPPGSICMAFVRHDDSNLSCAHMIGVSERAIPDEFSLYLGEGSIGKAAVSGECRFAYGRSQVSSKMEVYEPEHRAVFNRLWGERGVPSFTSVCPVVSPRGIYGVVFVALYDVDEKERGEWERLLILASGLYSLRLVYRRTRCRTQDEGHRGRNPRGRRDDRAGRTIGHRRDSAANRNSERPTGNCGVSWPMISRLLLGRPSCCSRTATSTIPLVGAYTSWSSAWSRPLSECAAPRGVPEVHSRAAAAARSTASCVRSSAAPTFRATCIWPVSGRER